MWMGGAPMGRRVLFLVVGEWQVEHEDVEWKVGEAVRRRLTVVRR